MSAKRKPLPKFQFDRSFDDPGKLYMPNELRRAEREAMAAAAAQEASRAAASNMAQHGTEEAPPAEPAEPEVKFTQGELDAAREDGFVEGHAKAVEEAATAREHYIADAVNVIGQSLDKLSEKQAQANRETGETALRMVYAVLRKIVPELAMDHAVESIGAFVKDVLPLALGEPKIIVRVHGSIVDLIDERLKEVFARSSFQGGYTVVTDFELQPGDCRLDWAGGGADRTEARIWAEIRKVIAANFSDVDIDALDRAADTEAAAMTLDRADGAADHGAAT